MNDSITKTGIIRHAYGEGESYVEMALRAQEQADEEIFIPAGVMNIGQPESVFMHIVISSAENPGNLICLSHY